MLKNVLKVLGLLLMLAAIALLLPSTTLVEAWPVEGSVLGHNDALATVLSLPLRPFGLSMALGAAVGIALSAALAGKRAGASAMGTTALCVLPCALVGGHLTYCLTMLGSILADYEAGWGVLAMPHLGGYTLYGAVLGALAGIALAAKVTGKPFAVLADAAAPGAALAIAVGRAAEVFIAQGLGDYIENEALWRFPLLMCTYPDPDWPQWQIPVFFYEVLAALVILAVLLALRARGRRDGRVAETFVALLGVTQIMLESLRRDEFIRFGFVRFSQLAAAVTVAAVLALRVYACVRSRGWTAWQIARVAVFAVCVGIVILLEFALDKSPIDNLLLYAVMAVTQVAMGVAILRDGALTEVRV